MSPSIERSDVANVAKDLTANPAPLGLMGFGMTTMLLNLHNIGLYELNSMILAMGIFMGGLAQVLAGVMEWKKGNTFGTTAFTAYGMFWLALVGLLVLPSLGVGTATDPTALAAFLAVWGAFSLAMFLGTLRLNRALQVVFSSLTLLFLLLTLGNALGNPDVIKAAGAVGIFCAASAMYVGLAQVLNETYGRTVAPLGPVVPVERRMTKLEEAAK